MDFLARVETLKPKLRAIARQLDGRFTAFNDDDLYQEALLSWWQKYQRGEWADKTDSFVLQGGYFTMKNFIRTNHRRIDQQSVSLEATLSEGGAALADRLAPEDKNSADKAADQRAVMAALRGQLRGREAVVLALAGEGLSTREIGRRLGISHVMVGKINKRIRAHCLRLRQTANL